MRLRDTALITTLISAASAESPPAFSQEFALNYTVTNYQYGFTVLGRWSVDHSPDGGVTLHERERVDTYNKTLEPRVEVKDFLAEISFTEDDETDLCCLGTCEGGQPAWAVPDGSLKVEEHVTLPSPYDQGEGQLFDRWRSNQALDQGICVDFFVGLKKSGDYEELPSLLQWFGNCSSAEQVQPEYEFLAQDNFYNGFDLSVLADELFAQPADCQNCDGTNRSEKKTTAYTASGKIKRTTLGDLRGLKI